MDEAKPVPIATISGTQPTPESEMDALLLGRTGVSPNWSLQYFQTFEQRNVCMYVSFSSNKLNCRFSFFLYTKSSDCFLVTFFLFKYNTQSFIWYLWNFVYYKYYPYNNNLVDRYYIICISLFATINLVHIPESLLLIFVSSIFKSSRVLQI